MCGIVGYTGKRRAGPILLDGLSRLEYRGYDSAGMAVRDGNKLAEVVKATGKLIHLADKTDQGRALEGTCGIGHTRWATHGDPSLVNAHPHVSGNCTGSASGPVESEVVGVHNGIIENYAELKEKLLRHGYTFYSDTDTEVLVKLVDYYYNKYKIGPVDAITRTMVRVRGSYALGLMFQDYPGEIFAARKDSPLIIGTEEDASYLASDVPAILKYTRDVYYIENLQVARISPGHVSFYDLNGDERSLPLTTITWDASAAEKEGYEHFMLKEIHEQPEAVQNTLNSLAAEDEIHLEEAGITQEFLAGLREVDIVACGSAWHVGMAARVLLEDLAGVPTRVELASEYRYRSIPTQDDTLVVIISQSGETADSLAALRAAKERGAATLAVVNVVGSSIAREADHVIYTKAGPEIAVATTKAYSAQLIVLYILAIALGAAKGRITSEQKAGYIRELRTIPDKIRRILEEKERLQWFSSKIVNAHDIFFIGRGLDYAMSLEGSLKMKEISYIHSEAYAAGELKHGTISLIENNTLVVGLLTQSALYEKTLSNMTECKARGAYLMGITPNGNFQVEDSVNFALYIPRTDEHFFPSLAVIPLQLLAYYTSVNRGLDVDKPRNLAKSVTVE
ncbi:MAG: glutamine--fructose-6-phosphate transaminase (isomerizing) [Clostridia bacterium]|nr:glutamine--fructose-6-phosphate transaminase (isomerizing) [Clostridia bacterium]